MWTLEFLLLVNFCKILLEKYDFDLFKGFFMEKMTQICQILKILMISSIRKPSFFFFSTFIDVTKFG
jgi:hypothetical protein